MSAGASSFLEILRDFSSVGEACRVSTTVDMVSPGTAEEEQEKGAGEGEVAMAERGDEVYIRPAFASKWGFLLGMFIGA